MIPGKLYECVGYTSFSLFDGESIKTMKATEGNGIVLVIECVNRDNCYKILTADGNIGNIYYYSFRWNEL